MKTTLKLGSLAALSILGLAACGGDIFGTNTDGGTNNGNCPAGVTLYSLPASKTTFTTTSVTNISDTCHNPPYTSTNFSNDRSLEYFVASGTIELTSASGALVGRGAIACNSGSLVSDEFLTSLDGKCTYRSKRTSVVTMTSNNTFTLGFTETQTEFTNATGMTCVPPTGGSCSVAFTANLTKK